MLKKIKSLFIIEEEGSSSKTSSNTPKKKVSLPESAPLMPESNTGQKGKISGKFTDILLRSMDQNNLEGFDYLEFKKSLQSLANMPMDEATRYKSAFAMAKTMGVSPAKLMETAKHYINILKQEERKFEEALANQENQQVGSKKKSIQQLELTVKQKAEQIKRLTKEIDADQKKMETLKKEITQRSQKIETTKNNFIASFNNLVAQIHQDMENMKQYLS